MPLIALGLSHYGLKRGVSAIFEGLFDAAAHMDMMRFPELFCGFPRRRGTAPVLYPVACAPQAWASVVPFALLQACLGVRAVLRQTRNPLQQSPAAQVPGRDPHQWPALGEASVNLRLRRRGAHTKSPSFATGRHLDQDYAVTRFFCVVSSSRYRSCTFVHVAQRSCSRHKIPRVTEFAGKSGSCFCRLAAVAARLRQLF
jgi:hypothetical protein